MPSLASGPTCAKEVRMNLQKQIIVVDDDPELRHLLRQVLSDYGFSVRALADAKSLIKQLAREPAHAIVLDLMMPDEDGLMICRQLRASGDETPILMLTARGDPMDRILGLEMGADDYLAKPFAPRELVARLSAILRRTSARTPTRPQAQFQFGPFTIDTLAMTVLRDGATIPLSSREYALLTTLAASSGHPLSRPQLIDRALGRDADVTDRAIDVQIARLRKALGEDPNNPQWIKTVWGVGYVLTEVEPC
jgi:two-component system, OmpR family, phosphate regulon response regulator OmpR